MKKKIPRIVRAYLLMLGLVVGLIVGGLAMCIAMVLLKNMIYAGGIWALIVFVSYLIWFLTASKYRDRLVEWGVIE